MKKTVTVNLDKTIFNIDDDAYTVLESYLEALHDHFKKEEGGQEIMNDIESRISELFKERLGFGMQVITLQEVNEVIAIMGQPEEIENPLDSGTAPDNNAEGDNSGQTTDTSNNESHKSTKRLYRDPDNRILGGVASGMGYYFGIDTVAIRVIMVLLLPLWASSVWIYLLLWICIPEARTTSQKLEMRGETPTVDNIKRAVEEEKENVSRNGGVANSIWRSMGSIFRGLFKFIFICIGGLIAISIIGALVTCIISILGFFFLGTATITPPFFSIFPGGMHVLNGHWELVVFTLSLFFTFGIPLYAILRAVLGSIFHWKAQSSALNIFLLVLWILSLVGLFVSTFIYIPKYPLLNL